MADGFLPTLPEAVAAVHGFTLEQHKLLLNYLGEDVTDVAQQSLIVILVFYISGLSNMLRLVLHQRLVERAAPSCSRSSCTLVEALGKIPKKIPPKILPLETWTKTKYIILPRPLKKAYHFQMPWYARASFPKSLSRIL
eukprot:SAG11_NODE_4953_length_1711_cov_2.717742_2_plen_139_part_00